MNFDRNIKDSLGYDTDFEARTPSKQKFVRQRAPSGMITLWVSIASCLRSIWAPSSGGRKCSVTGSGAGHSRSPAAYDHYAKLPAMRDAVGAR